PWGSQAHHFPGGKEQLAAEAIARSGSAYERMLRVALSDLPPADAVAAWAAMAAQQLEESGWCDGCPVATVALEQSAASDALAGACGSAFESWRRALADGLTARGVAEAKAESLATLILAAVEGGLVIARAGRDPQALRTVGAELAGVIRAATAAP